MKKILLALLLCCCLTACALPARVNALERLFPDLSLEFLGEYQLPKQSFRDTVVGGLSGITYDRQLNQFYAVSDDRRNARFYTLTLDLDGDKLQKVNLTNVTFLKDLNKQDFAPDTIDPEGIALSPRRTLFISSEGNIAQGVEPFIGEFNLENGEAQEFLPIPERYLPNTPNNPPRGIENNQGFESLTLGINSTLPEDPFRVFSAVESPLKQDSQTPENNRLRFLHYGINPIGFPVLVAEHLYLLEPTPPEARNHGLVELLALPKEGYFLSLERTFSLTGFSVKIFQVVNASATDTSRIASLAGDITNLQPLRKKLLLDLGELAIDLDNLEGMTWGPRFADGSQSLLLVSDDNFQKSQVQQFLLFRLREK
jgi:hypothetical protein